MSREFLESEEEQWIDESIVDDEDDEELDELRVPRSGRRQLAPIDRLR